MLQLFFTGFSTKSTTKMLKKLSRTHRKRFRNFSKGFRQGSGVKIKTQCENSNKMKEYEINSNKRPRPKVMHGSGSSISYTAIGLIQVQF
jgi:hypothetical protein